MNGEKTVVYAGVMQFPHQGIYLDARDTDIGRLAHRLFDAKAIYAPSLRGKLIIESEYGSDFHFHVSEEV